MLESFQICFWKGIPLLQRKETKIVGGKTDRGLDQWAMSPRMEVKDYMIMFSFDLTQIGLKFSLDNEGAGISLFTNEILTGTLAQEAQTYLFFSFYNESQHDSYEKGNQ